MKKMKKTVAFLSSLLLMCSIQTVQAATDTSSASGSVSEGEFSVVIPSDTTISDITLTPGAWSDGFGNIPTIRVNDARGTGDGWSLFVEASQLTEVGGAGYTIPTGNLTIADPQAVSPVGPASTADTPWLQTGGPYAVDQGPIFVAEAEVDHGLGSWDISYPVNALQLSVNPSFKIVDSVNYPGVPTPYQSTLTWTLNNVPFW
ncbi:WxL domain-containing protein (plasmid) [Pontibacillus sp. ALD_SL1]|uniref:WxL domain-containing protein n=1 Tax=Pontibacillus sp. ALD_SL1 TaxID=2777185 RepID=UPI001A96ED69|nr:WxL domain-containing protein [Pontibacillus sp. ALD_SL1]QST02649.1 WxL domain-containing protein [Pontibacillus sp. ALD_SL1]